jgi:endonuclease-3
MSARQSKQAVARESRSASHPLSLREVVGVLRRYYGPPTGPVTTDPFELILWENVAYLATPSRRREAFEELKRTVGTLPAVIQKTRLSALERVTARGILKRSFAAKLRECARIVVEDFGGNLDAAISRPADEAKRALRTFPGIGEPGAEKILLFSGRQGLLAPDSNGLRVLARLGLVSEEKSYARMYAAGRRLGEELGSNPSVLQEAHLLLQQHGQTICKRTRPRCEVCPLAATCEYARRGAMAVPKQ